MNSRLVYLIAHSNHLASRVEEFFSHAYTNSCITCRKYHFKSRMAQSTRTLEKNLSAWIRNKPTEVEYQDEHVDLIIHGDDEHKYKWRYDGPPSISTPLSLPSHDDRILEVNLLIEELNANVDHINHNLKRLKECVSDTEISIEPTMDELRKIKTRSKCIIL